MASKLTPDAYDLGADPRKSDQYPKFLDAIQKTFNENNSGDTRVIFKTDAKDLFNVFLNNLPKNARQHYNCNACHGFIRRYGGLVTLDRFGNQTSLLWDSKKVPKFFRNSVKTLQTIVEEAQVTGVFVSSEQHLGCVNDENWTHMSIKLPDNMVWRNLLKTPWERMAEKAQDYRTLMNALNNYSMLCATCAVDVLRRDGVAGKDSLLGWAEWFYELKKDQYRGDDSFRNIVWYRVATAPDGFCHIPSSVLGALMDDISGGFSFSAVKERHNKRMDPLKYQRPQAAPTAGNVETAEKIVAKLGIERSLARRFARVEELQTVWKPEPDVKPKGRTGVFADVPIKGEMEKKPSDFVPRVTPTKMTWAKFQREVLPKAKTMELWVGTERENYAAILTAEHEDAPPILKWDKPGARNPFNWYMYRAGSYARDFNLIPNTFTEVTAITLSPNMWQPGYKNTGKGVFIILGGCKDVIKKETPGSALFPVHLISELHEVRATIEAYSKKQMIGGYDEASACGLALFDGGVWRCHLRVHDEFGTNEYILDRWD